MNWYEEMGQALSKLIARLDAIQRCRDREISFSTPADDFRFVGFVPASQQADQSHKCSEGMVE